MIFNVYVVKPPVRFAGSDEWAEPQLPQLLEILAGQLLGLARLRLVPEPEKHGCDVPEVEERRDRIDPGQARVGLGCCPPAQHVTGADTNLRTRRPWCAGAEYRRGLERGPG